MNSFRPTAPNLLALIAFLLPFRAEAICNKSDIEIIQASFQRVRSYVRAVGEIRNRCDTAVGAELQVVFRDGLGQVVLVDDPWPASTDNIPANGTIAFEVIENDPTSTATKVTVAVEAVKVWP